VFSALNYGDTILELRGHYTKFSREVTCRVHKSPFYRRSLELGETWHCHSMFSPYVIVIGHSSAIRNRHIYPRLRFALPLLARLQMIAESDHSFLNDTPVTFVRR
jgi:hypothetical protein